MTVSHNPWSASAKLTISFPFDEEMIVLFSPYYHIESSEVLIPTGIRDKPVCRGLGSQRRCCWNLDFDDNICDGDALELYLKS